MQVKCKFCSAKSEKEEMVCIENMSSGGKVARRYYHKDCLKKLKARDEAKEKVIEYTGFLGTDAQIYVAFSKAKAKGLDEIDILYTIDYIIKNKCVLNYPMGLLYYIDRAMREKRKEKEIQEKKQKILSKKVKIQPLQFRREEVKQEQEEKTNEFDISDFIDEE